MQRRDEMPRSKRKDLSTRHMELPDAAHHIAEANGSGEESATFSRITFGLELHAHAPVEALLVRTNRGPARQREDQAQPMGALPDILHLIDQCVTVEEWATAKDGVRNGTLPRSGRPITESDVELMPAST